MGQVIDVPPTTHRAGVGQQLPSSAAVRDLARTARTAAAILDDSEAGLAQLVGDPRLRARVRHQARRLRALARCVDG